MTTAQVAERLGVRPATVYAYVSRGLLRSVRGGDGRTSLFDEAQVEALAAGRRHAVPVAGAPVIHTGLTLIRDGRLSYRGRDAVALAGREPFEAVAHLLWTGEPRALPCTAPAAARELAAAVTAPLPATARPADRMRVAVAAAAAADPLRFDLTPAAVVGTARALLGTMVAALPLRGTAPAPGAPLAAGLWPRLTAAAPAPAGTAVLDAALVLLADHDIAASTLAARVAASTRAHPYAVVGAGLAALDGPLHGTASAAAYALLADVTAAGGLGPVAERLRGGSGVPGFGHRLYPDGDPRAAALFAALRADPGGAPAPVLSTVDALAGALARRSGAAPTVDLALAALALAYGMGPDAGEAVFALARTAGWIAHALEEYADRPLRFRPSGRYDGPAPASDHSGESSDH